jgi:hypothetical protein
MTFWKVDLLKADAGTQRTHWFRNSSDAALFCDSVSGDMYENAYYCREVSIPNVVIDAAERQARAKAQTVVPRTRQQPQAEVADPLASMRIAS